jgi:hypothetical protein
MKKEVKKARMIRYENKITNDIFWTSDDPVWKMIEGERYLEVTTSLTNPKIHFVMESSLTKVGEDFLTLK